MKNINQHIVSKKKKKKIERNLRLLDPFVIHRILLLMRNLQWEFFRAHHAMRCICNIFTQSLLSVYRIGIAQDA